MDSDEVDSEASTAISVHLDEFDTDTELDNADQDLTDHSSEPSWVPVCIVPVLWADPNMLASQSASFGEEVNEEWLTTVMLRNLPIEYTCEMLLELFDSMGFSGLYDFVYLPIDYKTRWGRGFAFINLISPVHAQHFMKSFDGFSNWPFPSQKVCKCTWSDQTQGLDANIARYRNNSVMHPSLPADWKPLLFWQGVLDVFPPPTKRINVPRF